MPIEIQNLLELAGKTLSIFVGGLIPAFLIGIYFSQRFLEEPDMKRSERTDSRKTAYGFAIFIWFVICALIGWAMN